MTIKTNIAWPRFIDNTLVDTINNIRKELEMMTIEEKIRAKKEEVKRVNRELSKLQDEARAKNEPLKIEVHELERGTQLDEMPASWRKVLIFSNREIGFNLIKSAIESLSEKNDDPKSYVDWSKIDDRFKYVSVHSDGVVGAWSKMPRFYDLTNNWCANETNTDWCIVPHTAIVGVIPRGDKSLIHRPGIKE